jgi:hypothetical protein
MQSLTLAHRDDDRTPVIFAIREIAKRHYGLEVRIVRIQDGEQAIANTDEIAAIEYPDAQGLNPLALWDLHWVKDLDDGGLSTSWLNRCRVSPNPLIVIPAQAGIQEWRWGIRVRTLARPWTPAYAGVTSWE